MERQILAVLIHESTESFRMLEGALHDLSVETYSVEGHRTTISLIARLIERHDPLLVFVDQPTWEESHAEIIHLAGAAHHSFNAIVVGSLPDIDLQASVLAQGAYHFVAPPFSHEKLAPVVHQAAGDAWDRREALAHVSPR